MQRSKERLQTDLIEAVLLHSPVAEEMAEDPLGLLVEMRAERHMGHIGVSASDTTEAIRLIEEDGRAEIIQIGFSLLEPEPTERLLPLAEERGIGIVIRSPLASGFLSGSFTADHEFGPDDHRSLIPRERLAARLREANSFMWLVEEGVAGSLSEARFAVHPQLFRCVVSDPRRYESYRARAECGDFRSWPPAGSGTGARRGNAAGVGIAGIGQAALCARTQDTPTDGARSIWANPRSTSPQPTA